MVATARLALLHAGQRHEAATMCRRVLEALTLDDARQIVREYVEEEAPSAAATPPTHGLYGHKCRETRTRVTYPEHPFDGDSICRRCASVQGGGNIVDA